MSIRSIEITGYRSIAYMKIEAQRIVGVIGQNGSGKSNIISALNYFYQNLTRDWEENDIFDVNNKYRNEIRIKITYDMRNILRIIQHNEKQGNHDYQKYYNKIHGISEKDRIVLEMIKRKGQSVEWNVDYNIRQMITSLFPMYFVDARDIELTDWGSIWELIGDLIKLSYDNSERIREDIVNIVDASDANLAKKMKQLKEVLNSKGINVTKLTSRQIGKIIAEMTVGGNTFQYENRNLQEYSNGTNAFNYTNLLIGILSLLKRYKIKEPIIILDEPEISLHMGMIDSLMDIIFGSLAEIQFFLSTHSTRCVKKLLEREELDYYIYHVFLKDKYSQIKRIKSLGTEDIRERVIITDAYTNSCFAKMVVNVEGETELEVLKNRYLKEIFPVLKTVEITMGMSNRIIHNITSPSKRNYQTQGLSICDMDKMLCKEEGVNRFKFKELNDKDYPVKNETYYYGTKREKTLYLRKRIKLICEKCRFQFEYPFFSSTDSNFEELRRLIKEYCKKYNIFVWDTTIEGALINKNNFRIFTSYMYKWVSHDKMENITLFLKKVNYNIQLNYIRMIFSGKNDYLMTKKVLNKENVKINDDLYSNINLVEKTKGWVSEWLKYYFLKCADIENDSDREFERFRKYIQEEENKDKIKRCFKNDFQELYFLLSEMEKQIEK